jgi:hypothetical protein
MHTRAHASLAAGCVCMFVPPLTGRALGSVGVLMFESIYS